MESHADARARGKHEIWRATHGPSIPRSTVHQALNLLYTFGQTRLYVCHIFHIKFRKYTFWVLPWWLVAYGDLYIWQTHIQGSINTELFLCMSKLLWLGLDLAGLKGDWATFCDINYMLWKTINVMIIFLYLLHLYPGFYSYTEGATWKILDLLTETLLI